MNPLKAEMELRMMRKIILALRTMVGLSGTGHMRPDGISDVYRRAIRVCDYGWNGVFSETSTFDFATYDYLWLFLARHGIKLKNR